jgi:hypothetical protein
MILEEEKVEVSFQEKGLIAFLRGQDQTKFWGVKVEIGF